MHRAASASVGDIMCTMNESTGTSVECLHARGFYVALRVAYSVLGKDMEHIKHKWERRGFYLKVLFGDESAVTELERESADIIQRLDHSPPSGKHKAKRKRLAQESASQVLIEHGKGVPADDDETIAPMDLVNTMAMESQHSGSFYHGCTCNKKKGSGACTTSDTSCGCVQRNLLCGMNCRCEMMYCKNEKHLQRVYPCVPEERDNLTQPKRKAAVPHGTN
jgi:hypothetical protein